MDPVELSGDPGLLALQQIDRYRPRIVRIQQLLALGSKFDL